MNVSAAGQTRLVMSGATGMVGGYALRYALDHPGGVEGHARIANRQVARSCLRDAPSRAWTAIPRKMVPK